MPGTTYGTVIEREGEYGWGKVRLDDGRELTFDITACVEGRPHSDVRVGVYLEPSRKGGEYVARLWVDEQWELVRELPFFVFAGNVHGVWHGHLDLDPAQLDVRIRGWTGYARLERRVGVTRHTTSEEITRVRGYRVAALAPEDRAAVCRQIEDDIAELEEVLRLDPGDVDEQVFTLTQLTELRKALHVLRPPSWFSRILGNN
jgi:hypothetical protein